MRRRAAEYRRPPKRRLSQWIWVSLALLIIGGIALFVFHHNHQSNQIVLQKRVEEEPTRVANFNITKELQSVGSFARQLSEQMVLAKAYVVIAKEHNDLNLAWELNKIIRSCQLLLSKAAMRGHPITLKEAEELITSLSNLIYKAQDAHYDVATTIMTMKSHIHALEDRASASTVQATVFGEQIAESFPKSLHCIHLKLNSDWITTFKISENESLNSPRLIDISLHHFCIFSDNVLSTSVVVNSTVINSAHPRKLVFHIVTNSVSFGSMQVWFLTNDFKGAMIEVKNVEELSILENPKSLLLNDLRFFIPYIYPQLEKIVFLEDDVVVQKDIAELFHLDLHGNVNGAVETCLESYHRFYKYLNFSNPIISSRFDPQACGWAFGLNVMDLIAWKRANVTERYRFWIGRNIDGSLWRAGTLPPAFLAFYGLVEPLDRRWHVLGLGYDVGLDNRLIESAGVVHFNGYMKPWLILGLSRYKPLWEKYVHKQHPHYLSCVTT